MPLLELKHLHKTFDGVRAVNGFSLSVPAGQILGMIGPNGSGKTTTFNLISGFLRPDKGEIAYEGRTIVHLPAFERFRLGITRLFQEVRVFDKLTALGNVLLAIRKQSDEQIFAPFFRRAKLEKSNREHFEKALHWLKFVGLGRKQETLAESLSFGQQKLLSLAMLLASDARLLLLDEPTAGLDAAMTGRILTLIKELQGLGKTIIMIEHELQRIFQVADTIVLMNNGQKVFEGPSEEIKSKTILKDVYLGNYKS